LSLLGFRWGLGFLLTWACFFASDPAFAEVAIPSLRAHITDLTGLLTSQQKDALERELTAFEAAKGSQIAVLILPTTKPEAIEQYSMRVVEQWKLGRKSVDDGVLLLVALQDRSLRIEVGYGLEGVLTDATSKRIITEIITPHFRDGDFYAGLQAGIESIVKVVEGEPLAAPQPQSHSSLAFDWLIPGLVLVTILGGILTLMIGRFWGALATGTVAGIIASVIGASLLIALFVALLSFILTLSGGASSGYRSDGYIGGSDWSSGGGGFSGGGGDFGGGGASGSW
jgi:uncharacterized protein